MQDYVITNLSLGQGCRESLLGPVQIKVVGPLYVTDKELGDLIVCRLEHLTFALLGG